MWNPDADVNALQNELYRNFYGPAAEPMADYWDAIYAAWDETLSIENEYFVAPVIYTPELMTKLKQHLAPGYHASGNYPAGDCMEPASVNKTQRFITHSS